MLFSDIAYVDENFEVVEHGYVGVSGDQITYTGTTAPAEDYGEIYNGVGKLLIPAFFNAHSHLPMALMRGYGENLTLMDWLQGRIFPFEAQMTADDIYWGCQLGIAEMLRYGIGGTSEMYIQQDPLGRAFLESGVKANFCQSVVWMEPSSYYDLPVYQDTLDTIAKYHGAGNGRLRTEFCLHAEYTNTETVAREIAEAAAANNSSIHVHVSETKDEVDMCRQHHQKRSPVRFLHDCGLFDVPTTAAHCVWVDDDDIEILREDGVTVGTCPKSNAKLASGIAPITKLLRAGVNVAIGTDSVASNNNLNMLEEMRFFSLFQKAKELDPTVITPKETLYAATRAGALAQQRPDCGLIKEGFKADLTVIDMSQPQLQPNYSYLNNLVYSASGSDVVLTMVDGAVLYRDGLYTSLDIERIVYEAERCRQRILGSLAE